MNRDSESFQKYLLGFLASINQPENHTGNCEDTDKGDHLLSQTATINSGELKLGSIPQTFLLGEIPTVQERFQAVIKRRLQIHTENHPPLFPWETQIVDYPDTLDEPSLVFSPNWGWMAQQSKLNLPIPLPEKVFQELLARCQQMVTSSLPIGAKLVQVVEGLFPTESHTINNLAGLVLRSSYRSPETLETTPNIESDYSDLGSQQQMAISLMAAQQLLDNLTLPVSPSKPVVERLWLTSAGALNLRVEYHSQGDTKLLRVYGDLPTQGILTLRGDNSIAMAQSSIPGCLSVEISCQQLHPTYTLEVECPELDQLPLLFVINPTI
ncbi:PatU [Anabaena sp. CCY 9402-a]|uniref:PatU n=1 Tax=Anabaena sp. CCY 9402-a TaxID=3103867 RepID=UPI0039C5CEF5